MSFYIKKSVRVGPVRFHLSSSKTGASIGIKGLRLGTGPRGNYIHIGAGGVHYRASISPGIAPAQGNKQPLFPSFIPEGNNPTHAPLQEIESSHIAQIVDSSSQELLGELNRKRKKIKSWPFAVGLTAGIMYYGFLQAWPEWCLVTGFIAGLALVVFAYVYDQLRKSTVLFYDLDDDIKACYQHLHDCAAKLASCSKIWHIEASGVVYNSKYHAGASDLIRRKATSISKAKPPFVKTNIETITISVGRQTLHFLPDRVLIFDKDGIGTVSYNQLQVHVDNGQFIESGAIPSDAQIVGRTWKYVNKSGGPDKRFKNNTQLPICLYQNILFTSPLWLVNKIF